MEVNDKKFDTFEGVNFGIQQSMEMSSAQFFDMMEDPETPPKKETSTEVKSSPKQETAPKKKKLIKEETEEEEEVTENPEDIDLLQKLEDADEENNSTEEEEEVEEDDDEINPFVSIGKNLYELGIFTQEEDDDLEGITDGETLRERFEYQKKKDVNTILENFLSRKGQEYKEMFDAVFVNGVNPKEYLQTYSEIQDFRNADLESEVVQKRIIAEGLRLNGFEDEDIEEELEKIEQYGDLEDKAKKYHKIVLKKQEEKLKEITENEQRKQKDEARKDQIYKESLNKILTKKLQEKEFDSIPVTPELANETMDYLYSKKWKTPSGKLITDFEREIYEMNEPENYENKVKLGLLMKLIKKDPQLKTLQRRAITKETNTVFSEIAEKHKKSQSVAKTRPKSWFNNEN